METSNNTSGGIGFIGLLTIVFITLKLTNVINLSWWLVLSPLIISFCVGIIIPEIIRFLILKDKI